MSGTPKSSQPTYGPRSLAALLPDVTRAAIGGRRSLAASLLLDWPTIVGPDWATRTVPRKLAAGTLTLACDGPAALELQHLAPLLIDRINRHLGNPAVERLRLIHQTTAPSTPTPTPPHPIDQAAIEARLSPLPDGPIRQALAALAEAMARG